MTKNASQSATSPTASSARRRAHATSARIIIRLQRTHSLANQNAQLGNTFPMEFAALVRALSSPARSAATRRRS